MAIRLYFSALLKILMPDKNLLEFKVLMRIQRWRYFSVQKTNKSYP